MRGDLTPHHTMTQPTNAMQAESLTMEAEAGEWGGDFDPFSDQEEKRVLFAALDSFRYDRLPVLL